MRLNPRPESPSMTLNTQFEPARFLVLPVSKRVYVRHHSHENPVCLHVHFQANQTHFQIKGFSHILKQRQKVTRKWRIGHYVLGQNGASSDELCINHRPTERGGSNIVVRNVTPKQFTPE